MGEGPRTVNRKPACGLHGKQGDTGPGDDGEEVGSDEKRRSPILHQEDEHRDRVREGVAVASQQGMAEWRWRGRRRRRRHTTASSFHPVPFFSLSPLLSFFFRRLYKDHHRLPPPASRPHSIPPPRRPPSPESEGSDEMNISEDSDGS